LPMRLADGDVGGVQIDIVSDQEFARADYGSAGGGMKTLLANVGSTIGLRGHFFEQAFELALANIFRGSRVPGRWAAAS